MNTIEIMETTKFEIGLWEFQSEFGRFVHKDGSEFFVDNRLNKLLTILLVKKETIIKRQELIDFVWDQVQVNEESLTKAIADLRKLMKEKEISDIEINTIRNIGYRLHLNEFQKTTPSKSLFKILYKSAFYFFLISAFLIMFIRAIRY